MPRVLLWIRFVSSFLECLRVSGSWASSRGDFKYLVSTQRSSPAVPPHSLSPCVHVCLFINFTFPSPGPFFLLPRAGEVSFYFRDKASQGMQHISEFRAPCTVLALWAPCGSYFATASTYPRMKVDNSLSVLDYRGKIHQPFSPKSSHFRRFVSLLARPPVIVYELVFLWLTGSRCFCLSRLRHA